MKYSCNAFHALKIAFANEVGVIAKEMGANGHEVMRLVCQDRKLNISDAYLRPGFAFGGSCLPKDLRAINRVAEQRALKLPLLSSVLPSNEDHLRRIVRSVRQLNKKHVGVVGISFKAGTDDLRESPTVDLVEQLLGAGCSVRIYDPNVMVSRLRGRNLAYIDKHLPHLAELMVPHHSMLINHAELILLCSGVADGHEWGGDADRSVIDLRKDFAV